MRVLIIEDDRKLANTYKSILNSSFDVDVAYNLISARKKLLVSNADVILLDIMLPDGKGYEAIDIFKKITDAVIIIISALEDQETKRIAYENGADDYMIKPITLFELEFKLKAINKRTNTTKMQTNIGDMILDFEDLTLSTKHKRASITHSQGVILNMLYEKYKNDSIIFKHELSDVKELTKNNNVRIHTLISRLRKTIEEIESDKVFVENVYGKGYRLVIMK